MTRDLRIVHVGKFAPGSANGVYAAIAGLVKHLPAEGVRVEMWHLSDSADRISESEIDGVKVTRLPRHKRNEQNAIALPRATLRALRSMADSVDLLHLHSVYQGHNVAVSRLDVPYIVSPHSGYTQRVRNGRYRTAKATWRALWEDRYVRSAESLHAVSSGEANELSLQGLARNVACIPNGLDDEWFAHPAQAAPNGPLVFLGRLAIDQKGLDLLVQGYAKAVSQVELPKMLLVGPDFRGSVSRLKQMISGLGLDRSIQVLPPMFGREKVALLESAGALVHPSRWDGMPFTVLEAMAMSRPVIITPHTNLGQEVHQYDAGVVHDDSVEGVANGLLTFASASQCWREEAGSRARTLVQENFTWSLAAHRMASLYRTVAA